ncbi:MAG: DUF2934 domain-containing protein [Acidobacteriia bacterium]|nr:DUF2934 domain-containing protein [Terriglobia bacterium]
MESERKVPTKKTSATRTKATSAAAEAGNPKKAAAVKGGRPRKGIPPEERQRLIAESAYLKAERRGFQGGDPSRDWIEAEAEIDAMLMRPRGAGE